MHDVVRDFAHWLTSTGENRFMVKDKLKEWPDMVESFECYTAIALWNCSSNIKNFPDKIEFSKLKTLFLQREWKGDSLVVSSTFFEEMKALQVLYLSFVRFSLKGFHSLPNLKTLWCEDCKVEDFSSSLTNMRSLEILALISTNIDEISEELVKLSTLKYLRLSPGVFGLEKMNIPPKLISRLTLLQELHVTSKNNINLLELNSLSRLTALSLLVFTNQFSQEDFVFPKLQRYNIVIHNYRGFWRQRTIRKLAIQNFSSSLSAFNNLFCNVEELELNKVSGLKNIVPSIGKKVLNELTSLELNSCNDMEFLTDITRDQEPTVAFSNLVKLNIEDMDSLKGLCYGLSPSHRAIASFTRLKVVTIDFCHKLKTIFSPYLAQSMLCIEELYISRCDGVKQVVGFAQEEEITKNDSCLCCCPKLRILEIGYCSSLKYVCANTSTQGLQSLESVKINDCPQLMQIFKMEQNENGQDVVLSQIHCWPKLKTFCIWNCKLFSCFIVQAQFLEILFLTKVGIIWETDVPVLNEECIVVGNHETIFQVQGGYSFSRIKELYLMNLFEVQIIWNDFAQVVTLENLSTLELTDCKKLIYIFSPTTARSLSHLTNITVTNCGNLKSLFPFGSVHVLPKLECLIVERNSKLEQVFELEDEVKVTVEEGMKFDKLIKLSLDELPNLIHFGPKGYHFVLSTLEDLKVRDCPKLTTSFSIDSQEFMHCETKESMENLISLQLGSFPELSCIWNGPNHCINLTTLKLNDCKKLRYIFSPTTTRSLSHLVDLFIEGCEEIERLILAKDQVSSSSSSNGDTGLQPISFPNLTNITVTNCGNLKSLFPFGSVPVLPKLESLIVKRNSKLEQVFELEDEVEVAAEEKMKFDKLGKLSLEKLPSLIHFCPKGYHFVLSVLIELKVRDCPKLTTSFSIDSREFVHCETKGIIYIQIQMDMNAKWKMKIRSILSSIYQLNAGALI
ncbi:uncharacterized protein LOC108451112 [Gossypium arboreum]|uniref:uncharacterized protein LOC108451112 n=1 Tax=Gossypium arboreum TaxID=29729 RepID=UPI0022F1582B|nr:uncharacterized protein LOC108451112 [Gossypium arboreum]